MFSRYIYKLDNVCKTYPSSGNDVVALNDVSIRIPAHRVVGIIGTSGMGKTTLLNILGGIDKPDEGTVLFNNNEIPFWNSGFMNDFRKVVVSWAFQELYLINHMNVWHNVALPLVINGKSWSDCKETAIELLIDLGLVDKYKSKPSQLSGGEKQRVAIAMAIAKKAKVLLADEPTGNLDMETGNNVMKHIVNCCERRNITVIMVTHDRSIVKQYCDAVFMFRDTGVIERIRNR